MMAVGFMIAGGIGSVLRFWLGNMLMAMFPHPRIPVSVMVVNIVGSFALGIFVSLGIDNQTVSIVVGTGFFGGFTTFFHIQRRSGSAFGCKACKGFSGLHAAHNGLLTRGILGRLHADFVKRWCYDETMMLVRL